MTKWDLPSVLFGPAVEYLGGAISTFSLRGPSGTNSWLVWKDKYKASDWLREGGAKLWMHAVREQFKKETGDNNQSTIILHRLERSYFYDLKSHNLHWEPEIGKLWSPPERIISLE